MSEMTDAYHIVCAGMVHALYNNAENKWQWSSDITARNQPFTDSTDRACSLRFQGERSWIPA